MTDPAPRPSRLVRVLPVALFILPLAALVSCASETSGTSPPLADAGQTDGSFEAGPDRPDDAGRDGFGPKPKDGGPDADAGSSVASGSYLLISPTGDTTAYLTDLQGREVHRWTTTAEPGQSVALLEDGTLFRTERVEPNLFEMGGTGGSVSMYSWDGKKTWSYAYATSKVWQHHDAEYMPNGHVLLVAWETKTYDEAVAAGREPSTIPSTGIWVDHVIEVDPKTNSIVWEWHAWDHLLTKGKTRADEPMRIDPNLEAQKSSDWTHVNSVRYNADLDQIVISVHNLNEIWVIDHSTTTAEAKGRTGGKRGRGGDLLYRWGNPSAYGASGAGQTYFQHDAEWIRTGLSGAGNFLIFDNGKSRVRNYSRVVEIVPPLLADGTYEMKNGAWGPDNPVWQYSATPTSDLFAGNTSGSQRLKNGNTQVTDGPKGRVFEVTPDGRVVVDYTIASKSGTGSVHIFRAERYESDYPGLAGRTLTLGAPIVVDEGSGDGGTKPRRDGGVPRDGSVP